MAYIKISLDHTILDGETVTFKAPCDCTAVDGIKVYYPTVSGSSIVTASKEFTFKDAHGNALTGLGNLFAEGAYIQAILNVTDGAAHILNADTNKYFEELRGAKGGIAELDNFGYLKQSLNVTYNSTELSDENGSGATLSLYSFYFGNVVFAHGIIKRNDETLTENASFQLPFDIKCGFFGIFMDVPFHNMKTTAGNGHTVLDYASISSNGKLNFPYKSVNTVDIAYFHFNCMKK